ncbi:dentin sialophosphoprotein [Camponotus floridanus]|uniref:dentin sialophosphoprotein n=1 Tax=Camponotus floridanus TaxID=104421 RepID=UPI00059C8B57|nr:dentin sialophosphoprotein [Camponotus floridanus]XP_025263891.1 dentin sialophosphoprotein [Camponotus floridanus]
MSRKSVQRRSALSFAGADDSIDHYIDSIVQSDPWKHIEKIEKSDAARIQSVLNEFNDRITQEKTCKADLNIAKKNSKQPTESVVKSSTEDLITTNSEGTSSNMHNDILTPKTKDQTRKKTSKKQTPKTVEETSSQELQHVVDDIKKTSKKKGRKSSEPNVKEIVVNESIKKTNKKDVINNDINLKTSTPKQKLPTTVGETAKDGKSIVRKRKMTDSENKSEKCIKSEGKKQRKRTSKKNTKDIEHCQDEVSKNMPSNEEKIMNMEEVKNLECSKENHNALKSEVKYKNKSNKKISDKNNHLQAEESKNISENKMKCNAVDNQWEINNICTKLKNKNELPKNVTSNKSSKTLKRNMENTKCQCKKKCTENCGKDKQCLKTNEQLEKRREYKKSKKAAKAMAKLSQEISTVKKKMESIKNDLENSESSDSSDYSDEFRSYSSSYSSYSGSSHSSDYSSTDFTSDDTEYTNDSSDSSTCSEDTNTSESKSSR